MPREDAATKARRYLVEGRLNVVSASADDQSILVEVRGDSRFYLVSHENDRAGWRCSCPSLGENCSHVVAVRLIFGLPARRPA